MVEVKRVKCEWNAIDLLGILYSYPQKWPVGSGQMNKIMDTSFLLYPLKFGWDPPKKLREKLSNLGRTLRVKLLLLSHGKEPVEMVWASDYDAS